MDEARLREERKQTEAQLKELKEDFKGEIGDVRGAIRDLKQAVADVTKIIEPMRYSDSGTGLQHLADAMKQVEATTEALEKRLAAQEAEAATLKTIFGKYLPWIASTGLALWVAFGGKLHG